MIINHSIDHIINQNQLILRIDIGIYNYYLIKNISVPGHNIFTF
jgi:hypothetical protein